MVKVIIARQWVGFLKPIETHTVITVHGIWSTLRNDSVVVTHCGLDGLGIKSRWGWDFLHLSRLSLGSTHPPVQLVLGLSQGYRVLWLGHGLDQSPPFLILRLKEEYICTSTPVWAFMAYSIVNFTFTLHCVMDFQILLCMDIIIVCQVHPCIKSAGLFSLFPIR